MVKRLLTVTDSPEKAGTVTFRNSRAMQAPTVVPANSPPTLAALTRPLGAKVTVACPEPEGPPIERQLSAREAASPRLCAAASRLNSGSFALPFGVAGASSLARARRSAVLVLSLGAASLPDSLVESLSLVSEGAALRGLALGALLSSCFGRGELALLFAGAFSATASAAGAALADAAGSAVSVAVGVGAGAGAGGGGGGGAAAVVGAGGGALRGCR